MGRRPNKSGSIFQRRDGRWCASLSLGNGKRKHYLGRTWDEVHQKLVAAQKSMHDGLPPVADERQTVKQFLTSWLVTTKSSRKPRTQIRYEQLVRLHVIPHIGSSALTRLTPQQLQGAYAVIEKGGLSPTTVRQVHAVVHKAFKQAVMWGSLPRNPADFVQKPRAVRKETTVLTPEQVRQFLADSKGTRFESLFLLAVTTGMRQGELLGLRWRDVDLDLCVITVRHAIQRIAGKFEFVEPKSAKSRRQVVLTADAAEALRKHRARQAEDRLRLGQHWEDNDLVFANEVGKPVEVSNLTHRYFRPLLSKAGLPRIRFHDLRHTAATLMLGAHVDVKVVSEVLGHSQTAFTMDRYQHVTWAMQNEAARAVSALLKSSANS